MDLHIENLELLNILQCVSSRRLFQNRASHALVFRRAGSTLYDFGNRKIPLHTDQVILIPKGSTFTVTQTSPGVSRYTVINFYGQLSRNEPQLIPAPADMASLYARLDPCCTLDPAEDKYLLLSHFYWILAQLFPSRPAGYRSSASFALLDPAIELLTTRLFDPDLKIEALYRLCGISDTYFRSLFMARFGLTPKKYLLERRLTHAWHLLNAGEYSSIGQVAAMSGFSDPLYFSKAFKARYGHPPSSF